MLRVRLPVVASPLPEGAVATDTGATTSRARATVVWLILVILLVVGLRVAVLTLHEPIVRNDTTGTRGPTYEVLSYRYLALGILRGDLSGDLGTRTPGYPAFLAGCFRLFGVDNWTAVVLVQSLLAVVVFAAAYWLWSQIYGGVLAVTAATATGVLDPVVILSESSVLSETLSIVLLMLAVPLALHAARRAHPGSALGAGLCVAGLALTRPAFQLLIPLLAIYLVIALDGWRRSRRGAAVVSVFVLVAALPVAGWSAFNYTRFGYFTPMTTQGYILTSHTAPLIAGEPQRYAPYADLAAIVDRYARDTGWGIWLAYPEIMRQRQVSFAEGSRLMERLSFAVVRDRPVQFARSVWTAFLRFWGPAVFVGAEWRDRLAVKVALEVYGVLHVLGCALFFVVLAIDLARPRGWLTTPARDRLLILGIVILVCLASTVPIAVENARYKVPLLPLMWGVVAGSLVTNATALRVLFHGWR
jgi:4-amino-4-deoxy-L-arabinose transferase-like glycosyltransferase